MAANVTPEEVAAWMLAELHRIDYLYQDHAVYEISTHFGEEFIYINQGGNLAIDKKVLAAFQKLTGESVVWERGQRLWRRRQDYDESGRRQY